MKNCKEEGSQSDLKGSFKIEKSVSIIKKEGGQALFKKTYSNLSLLKLHSLIFRSGLLQILDHPYLNPIFTSPGKVMPARECSSSEPLFEISITTEFSKDGNLLKYLEDGANMKEEKYYDLASCLLSVLLYLREKRVSHDNIKPENILFFAEEGMFKLSDYIAGGAEKQFMTDEDFFWKSPEMCNQNMDSQIIDHQKSDIYSLSLCLLMTFGLSLNSLAKLNEAKLKTDKETHDRFLLEAATAEIKGKDPQIIQLLLNMGTFDPSERLTIYSAVNFFELFSGRKIQRVKDFSWIQEAEEVLRLDPISEGEKSLLFHSSNKIQEQLGEVEDLVDSLNLRVNTLKAVLNPAKQDQASSVHDQHSHDTYHHSHHHHDHGEHGDHQHHHHSPNKEQVHGEQDEKKKKELEKKKKQELYFTALKKLEESNMTKFHFNLTNAGIGDKEVEALANKLITQSQLNYFNIWLSENSLSDHGVEILCQSLENCLQIDNFLLAFMETNISDASCEAISNLLSKKLNLISEYLGLAFDRTKVTDRSVEFVSKAIKKMTKLRELQIGLPYTEVSDVSLEFLYDALEEMKSVEQFTLLLEGTKISKKAIENFQSKLEKMRKWKSLEILYENFYV